MSDLDKRLDKIEQQLQVISTQSHFMPAQAGIHSNQMAPQNDEIDLRELWNVLWRGKWWVIGITFLFAMAGVFYALSLPNTYKSEGVYAPAQKEGATGGAAGQLGGLASLAGVSLGVVESNDIDHAMALISSWPFLEMVIVKHDLKPLIMGVKGWNRGSGELVWDEEVYDPVNKKWLREPPKGRESEPNGFEVFKELTKMLVASRDSKTGLVSVAVESYSPELSARLLDLIILELNQHFQTRDVGEAEKRIGYLERKIQETSISEMQAVFYSMVEAQLKTLMLAEVSDAYILKPVVDRKVPEEKNSPKRALIAIFAMIIGGVLSVVFLLVRDFIGRVIVDRGRNEYRNTSS